jgi:hypothetical protein
LINFKKNVLFYSTVTERGNRRRRGQGEGKGRGGWVEGEEVEGWRKGNRTKVVRGKGRLR